LKRIQPLPVCAGFFICIRNSLDRPCVTMPSWSSPAFKIQIIVPMQIIKICSTPNYWHLIFKAPFFYYYFLNQFRPDRKWLCPFLC
jgi:hypothetical protein